MIDPGRGPVEEGPGEGEISTGALAFPGSRGGVGGNAVQHYKRGDIPFQPSKRGADGGSALRPLLRFLKCPDTGKENVAK